MEIIGGIIEFVMDILETIVFVGSIFIVVYLFIVQPNRVTGISMLPTFHDGDYILTDKIAYKIRAPERGDVIVLQSPHNPDIDYIKRIIGLPHDTIMIKSGEVYVNGKVISENYISAKTNTWENGFLQEGIPFTVPPHQYFVMGDNRPRSSDSREFGPIPEEHIIGLVVYRYFPPARSGWIKNPWPPSLRE